jgi:Holliday junction resolvase
VWNRIENLSIVGMPDVLGYNTNHKFFTVELKVIKGNKIRFLPHQIAFHKTHPESTFILVRTHSQRSMKLVPGSVELGAWRFNSGFFIADSWTGIQESFDQIF